MRAARCTTASFPWARSSIKSSQRQSACSQWKLRGLVEGWMRESIPHTMFPRETRALPRCPPIKPAAPVRRMESSVGEFTYSVPRTRSWHNFLVRLREYIGLDRIEFVVYALDNVVADARDVVAFERVDNVVLENRTKGVHDDRPLSHWKPTDR